MHQEECIVVKFSEGLGIFDQHYGSPQIDEQEIYDGPTGKVIDIQGIQAHAGRDFFVPEGKEFSLNIDQCPTLHIAIKAEPGTNTCLFLLVHERKHDWNQRFVVIGKTPQGECGHHLMSNYFRIKDDNEWHEYPYDLRTIREEKDDNVYHQPICPDAGSIREIQFYSWTGSGRHTLHFNRLFFKKDVLIEKLNSFSVDELLQELRVREKTAEPSESFKDFDSATILKVLNAKQKVIYGVDNRQDLFQISDPKILSNADCVVSLFRDTDVVDNGNGTSTLTTQNFGTVRRPCGGGIYLLCATEPFRNQPSGSFCSGFLVGPDIVATAGHCINDRRPNADNSHVTPIRFVFGFEMLNATTAQTTINNNEIYRGVELIGRVYTGNGADWALVRLDRVVPNHTIAELRRSGKIPNNQAIHVIGHPSGLPVKFADGSNVRDNNPTDFFVANLDTYGGSSGSPVFNSDTYQVEGILVRGETDFTRGNGCCVSLVCPTTGCGGEDCTRTTVFIEFLLLPETGTGSIEGKVTDSKGAAISGANVIVNGKWTAYTDGNGDYALLEVPSGNRRVDVIKRPRYEPKDRTVRVNPGKTTREDFRLRLVQNIL